MKFLKLSQCVLFVVFRNVTAQENAEMDGRNAYHNDADGIVILERETPCVDVVGKFPVGKQGKLRSCKQIRRRYGHQCNTKDYVRENCPVSCGVCGPYGNAPTCYNAEGTFPMGLPGQTRHCGKALTKPILCSKYKMKKMCALNCNLCEPTFMQCPLEGDCCNGLESNCDLRVNEVMYASVHNANHHHFFIPNHDAPLEEALQAGYRGLYLDVCKCGNELEFCHGVCDLGKRHADNVFSNIVTFLGRNPTEIIVLNFEMSAGDPTPTELWNLMSSISGMQNLVYVHTQGQSWPTMREMLEQGKQVIAFQHNGGSGTAQIPDFFDYTMGTDWHYEDEESIVSSSSCNIRRGGDSTKDFFSMNHFVTTRFGPSKRAAKEINQQNVLETRINSCTDAHGKMPNFVSVDFWQQGDLLLVTQEMNKANAARRH